MHSTQLVDSKTLSLGVLILAAGASSRMGRPKMLLPWGTTSVLGHLVEQWQKLPTKQIAVVAAANDRAIEAELRHLGFPEQNRILNPNPKRGMFSSIQCAARWNGWHASLTHWLIVLGDQPHLRRETLLALVLFIAERPLSICQPTRNGRPKHPVVLPAVVFKRLQHASAENFKQFLQDQPSPALCTVDDPGLDFDLDEPADYQKALQLAATVP